MTILQNIIGESANRPTTIVLQSSSAQSTIPVLRQWLLPEICKNARKPKSLLLFSLLYPPEDLLNFGSARDQDTKLFNWLDAVPGYCSSAVSNSGKRILESVEQALAESNAPISAIIDSVDTLASDVGSLSETYKYLRQVHVLLASRPGSLLVLHGTDARLMTLLVQPTFASTVLYLKGYPPGLVNYVATEYLTPPPPYSSDAKFWSVFTPISERQHTVNELVFGIKAQVQRDSKEILLEVLVRRPGTPGSKKRSIERELEAWSEIEGPCEWTQLESLRSVWSKQSISEPATAPDPTQNLPFNLTMTTAQQEARAQVPLPYAHEGEPVAKTTAAPQGVILYDPDSADDIDDDDPDEDLDI